MSNPKNNKCVLAYSGGLDTTFCVKYLQQERGLDVYTVFVNTGAFDAVEVEKIEQKAIALGVKAHKTIDVSETFYNDGLKYLLFGNVLKNDSYPLSVSAERVFQAKTVLDYVLEIDASAVAHGSTGAGNDQVRFDLIFQTLAPHVEIITPIRELQLSRQEEIDYLHKNGVEIDGKKAQYSINQGLWGTSVGGAETLTSHLSLPEDAWPFQCSEVNSKEISITFVKGEPVALNGKLMTSVALIQALDKLGNTYAIGRDIHVGDTIIGIKGRVGFSAAAPLILIKAHQLLEKHTLSKWQMQLKKQQSEWYGMLFHEGQFMDPVMRDIEAMLQSSQERVSGEVFLVLHQYRFELQGVKSDFDLMNSKVANYGEDTSAWTSDDAKGFIKLTSNAGKIWHSMAKENTVEA